VATSAEGDDRVVEGGGGWSLLFADRHPHAGSARHYVATWRTPAASRSKWVAVSW
jgi:hypothetical protein